MFSLEPAYRHTWLIWATSFLVPWAALFIAQPKLRSRMAWAMPTDGPVRLDRAAVRARILAAS
jgi:hypothetical protein